MTDRAYFEAAVRIVTAVLQGKAEEVCEVSIAENQITYRLHRSDKQGIIKWSSPATGREKRKRGKANASDVNPGGNSSTERGVQS